MKQSQLLHRQPRFAVLVMLLIVAGCRPEAEIHNYEVPKEPRAAASADSSKPGPHRMLAAVVPRDGNAWFFKVVGPTAVIESIEQQVSTFLAALTFPAGADRPKWELPGDWQEEAGTGMRVATFLIPAEDGPLEMSVMSLPWTGDGQGGLLANVNRWRGQLQLPPIGLAGLGDCLRELPLEAGGMAATLVDLRGTWQEPDMPRAEERAASGTPTIPPDHPPVDKPVPPPVAKPTVGGPLQLETPEGWEQRPASGMRKADYQIVIDGQQAEVTVMDFPATPGMADPLGNVNRWRRQVGLGPIDQAELQNTSDTIEVAGHPATIVEMFSSKDSVQSLGMLAAMCQRDDKVWFFKMMGDGSLVETQRERFRQFLSTVQFTAETE